MTGPLEQDLKLASALAAELTAPEDSDALALVRLLAVRLREPQSYVTVAGETSTGKSSLINGLFGWLLLPVQAKPTTAAVTQLACRDQDQAVYFAIFRDATQAPLQHEQFAQLCTRPPTNLLRLQARASPASLAWRGLQVFDTPGYNAMVAEHEEILREFLPQSDVIVFVVGYRTGFGQVDQDLLEVIATSTEADPDIPVIVVVNRVPVGRGGEDNRIKEITSNASDSMRRPVRVLLVETATPDVDQVSGAPSSPPVPATTALWDEVAGLCAEPARRAVVAAKLHALLGAVLEERRSRAEREVFRWSATAEERAGMEAQVGELRVARQKSLAAIEACRKRLEALVPPAIPRLLPGIKSKLGQDIDGSEKWLGADDCANWLTAHAMPFEVRAAARSVEDFMGQELAKLDDELAELANTAVGRIREHVHVKSEAEREFAENLTRIVLQRGGGAVIGSLLRGMGGVGGAAAGAGNLAKMAVSKIGSVFGRSFGRGVYNQIGRTFTKRALQRLNVVVSIVLDVAIFIRQAHTWKGKLKEGVSKALDQWSSDVTEELVRKQLPAIAKANVEGIRQFYDDLIAEADEARRAEEAASAPALEEAKARLARFEALKRTWTAGAR